ncbi:TnsA-like heteromeric transposase endonuclease subunit [Dactylosporangium sp. NPDC050688]|uniref:TnsA-like heteromeric transposase endonuclease subunit n=1 Tax=Dactylosporangium sp. NPDC050688 TaxID=3157217 RepID=UPI0033DDB88A
MNDPVMAIDMHDRLASVGLRYRLFSGGDLVESTLARVVAADLATVGPVREFRWYKGRRFYSGWYWSSTTGGLVAYESLLELARILLADFDPDVSGIAAQPFQMREESARVTRRHVPDLLLSHRDGRVTVVDVKPAGRLADVKVRAVFGWTAELLSLRGWDFEVWSGADLVTLANVRFLAGYRRAFTVDTDLCPALLELADAQTSVGGIERAAGALGAPHVVRPVLLYLLWSGRLRTELSTVLSAASPVWRAEQ